jgi:hypothetical protein
VRRCRKPPLGDAPVDRHVEHRVADRAVDFFGEDNGRARLAGGIAEGREFHSRRASGDAHRTDAMNFNKNTVDVDFDGGKSKEPAGTNRRDRENSDRNAAGLRVNILMPNLVAAEVISPAFSIVRRQTRQQEKGGNVTRPRAADDFPAIRARMEELRRERADISTDRKPNLARRSTPSDRPASEKPRLLPAILRALARASTD